MQYNIWREKSSIGLYLSDRGVMLKFTPVANGGSTKYAWDDSVFFLLSYEEAGKIASAYDFLVNGVKVDYRFIHDTSKISGSKTKTMKEVRLATDPDKQIAYIGLFVDKDKVVSSALSIGDLYVVKKLIDTAIEQFVLSKREQDNGSAVDDEVEPPDDMPF